MKKTIKIFVSLLLITLIVSFLINAASSKNKGSVSMLAVAGGVEIEALNAMFKAFEEKYGIKVELETSRDLDAILTTRVEAGNPPDIVALPGPGHMISFGKAGKLVDLKKLLDMNQIKKDYAEGWLDLGTVDGKLVGLFYKSAIKGLIWYNPKQLKAIGINTLPKTWDEMMDVSKKIIDKGKAPFAIGVESGAASGWVGTDWIENIFVRLHGAKKYQDWQNGKLAWTSPEVKEAWQYFGKIVANEKMIYGGKQYALATAFGDAHAPLFSNNPGAYFHHQASFIQSFIQKAYPDLKPVEDFNFFGFPSINPKYSKAVESAGDVLVVFNNTPQSKALINYLASIEAQTYWAKIGNLVPNKNVPLSAFPDELTKNAAGILSKAEIVVFDAGDMMPGDVNMAFFGSVVSYIQDPGKLESILANLDKISKDAFSKVK